MSLPRVAAFACLLVACTGGPPPPAVPSPAPPAPDDGPPLGRLDDRARPLAYALELELDPGADGFAGTVTIELELSRPSRVVWLHARDLVIEQASLTPAGGAARLAAIAPDRSARHTEGQADLVGLTVAEPLPAGRARATLRFRGPWAAQVGVVRAGEPERFVISDFEPTDARTAFPCFDEPRFKTPWTVSLVVPDGLVALSNYPEVARAPAGAGRTRVRFAPSRPMSTYLVAVAVGRFEIVEGPRAPVPLRVITTPGTGAMAAHVLATAPRLLDLLVAYLDEPVPYPKLDLFAMPETGTSTGGMENPGLITIKARSLLLDPLTSTAAARLDASHVLAHELAHLWFGDLLTLGDWRELWLNEGLATWLGHELMAALEPGWGPSGHTYFAAAALLSDDHRRAVQAPITTPDDIRAMFDVATYAGGAAFVATLEAWLGEARLQRALRGFIDRHRDGTVTTADALAAIAGVVEGPEVDLAAIARGLLDSPRNAAITVTPYCPVDQPARLEVAADAAGPLPICVGWDGGAAPRCAVVSGTAQLELPTTTCPRWVLPDPGGLGMYRWRLGAGWTGQLVSHVALTSEERAALERWFMADVADAPLSEQIDVLAYLAGWGNFRAAERLFLLERALIGPAERADFVARVQARQVGRPIGLVEDPALRGGLTLAGWLGRLGGAELRAAARRRAAAVLDGIETGYFTSTTVLGVAAAADPGLWRRIDRAARAKAGPARVAALVAAGGFQDRKALGRVRGLLASTALDVDDRARVLDGVADNPVLRDHLADLLVEHAGRLRLPALERLGGELCDGGELVRVAAALTAAVPDHDDAASAITRMRERAATCLELRTWANAAQPAAGGGLASPTAVGSR